MGATLEFLGAAGTVTGAKFLLSWQGRRALLDCGLFQGWKALRLRNWAPPPFAPEDVGCVVLSHAHLDHSGALPLLVRRGFRGDVHCTAATADLLAILLPDAARLQCEEAATANARGSSKHRPALPLFDEADAAAALDRLVPHDFGATFEALPGLTVRFRHAGHILGAAIVEATVGSPAVRVVYSGDLGRPGRPLLPDPARPARADVVLVESTYGDRSHDDEPDAALAAVVRRAEERGGALLVPAFAVGRTQEILWRLRSLEDRGEIPHVRVFVDSPMATAATAAYHRHLEPGVPRGTLLPRSCRFVRSVAESKALNGEPGPIVVVAGSGMITGGRILHHLIARAPDERTTILLAGFQAGGTRGRSLLEGARTLRIFGVDVTVRARVETVGGLSAHADREGLLEWLGGFERPPRATWVVHGEPPAARALAAGISRRLGWRARPAADGERVSLDADGPS